MTSVSTLALFTGFEGADVYLTQPLLMVAGSEAGSLWHSQELTASAASKDKDLVIIKGATHMDLYDGEGATAAAAKLAPFFKASFSVLTGPSSLRLLNYPCPRCGERGLLALMATRVDERKPETAASKP